MALVKCGACERTMDVEPSKCQFCGAPQPGPALELRLRRAQRAVILIAGILAGMPGGYAAGLRLHKPLSKAILQAFRFVLPLRR